MNWRLVDFDMFRFPSEFKQPNARRE